VSRYSNIETSLAMSTLATWSHVRSHDVHPCDFVPRCQVSRCPPLLHGLTLSSLAMSVPTILMVSRCQVSRFQSPRKSVALCIPTCDGDEGNDAIVFVSRLISRRTVTSECWFVRVMPVTSLASPVLASRSCASYGSFHFLHHFLQFDWSERM